MSSVFFYDEEANINWAQRLEDVGAHVVYGVVGHKTHAKMALVVRREGDAIRRYVHLGTGKKLFRDGATAAALRLVSASTTKASSPLASGWTSCWTRAPSPSWTSSSPTA